MVMSYMSLYLKELQLTSVKMMSISEKWLSEKHWLFLQGVKALDHVMVSLWFISVSLFFLKFYRVMCNRIYIKNFADMLAELSRRERDANIKPDPDLDIFMKVRNHLHQAFWIVYARNLKSLLLFCCYSGCCNRRSRS